MAGIKFGRVHETLELIEKQDEITVKDALDLFYDLYEDVKTLSGTVLEQHPLGDRDEAIGRLCWMARTVGRLYSRNEQELNVPEYASRWGKAGAKLKEAEEALQVVEEEAVRQKERWEVCERERRELLRQSEEREAELAKWETEREEWRQKIAEQEERKKTGETERERLKNNLEERQREALEAERLLEELRRSCEEPLRRLERRSRHLKECTAAWEADPVLRENWTVDAERARTLERGMREAQEEAEAAWEKYRGRYAALVRYLEG